MNYKSYQDVLTHLYLEDPCRTLPNALWKTLELIEKYETNYHVENGIITHVEMMSDETLYTYWNRDDNLINIDQKRINSLRLILCHYSQLFNFDMHRYHVERYFRLVHHHEHIDQYDSMDTYYFRRVDYEHEILLVLNLIKQCYSDIMLTEEDVLNWTNNSVYDEDLWIWVVDSKNSLPVGLVIAEYDKHIQEGSIEWLQVLPEYRNRGLAKALVSEVLKRLKQKARFTSVSGNIDSISNPYKVYKKCGFEGENIWYVLRR